MHCTNAEMIFTLPARGFIHLQCKMCFHVPIRVTASHTEGTKSTMSLYKVNYPVDYFALGGKKHEISKIYGKIFQDFGK